MGDTPIIRVLVVDDSALYRKVIQDIIESIPGAEVVGAAQNGRIALSKMKILKPDLITLDIEMPEMGGLEVLARLKEEGSSTGVLVLSTDSRTGAEITLQALYMGAYDFLSKPDDGSLLSSRKVLAQSLERKINAFRRIAAVRRILGENPETAAEKNAGAIGKTPPAHFKGALVPASEAVPRARAVAIGISTGGPAALPHVIPKLPPGTGTHYFVVQHMPPQFTRALAEKLNSISRIAVKEAEDQEKVCADVVYVAPGGMQMKVTAFRETLRPVIRILDDPPVNNCKPSVDYLFRSIADCYGNGSIGVIMTGMGYDGTKGLQCMKERGGWVIAQDEATSVVYSMPRRPVEEGLVDVVAPLEEIAGCIRTQIGSISYFKKGG